MEISQVLGMLFLCDRGIASLSGFYSWWISYCEQNLYDLSLRERIPVLDTPRSRLHRRTLCYSKSVEMLAHSIRLLIHYLKFLDVPVPAYFIAQFSNAILFYQASYSCSYRRIGRLKTRLGLRWQVLPLNWVRQQTENHSPVQHSIFANRIYPPFGCPSIAEYSYYARIARYELLHLLLQTDLISRRSWTQKLASSYLVLYTASFGVRFSELQESLHCNTLLSA